MRRNRYQLGGIIAELGELGAAEGGEGLLDDLLPIALSQRGHHRRRKEEDHEEADAEAAAEDDSDYAGGGDVEEHEPSAGWMIFTNNLAHHLHGWLERKRQEREERKCIEEGECGDEERRGGNVPRRLRCKACGGTGRVRKYDAGTIQGVKARQRSDRKQRG
jgi:hypothetical protein